MHPHPIGQILKIDLAFAPYSSDSFHFLFLAIKIVIFLTLFF